MKSVVGNHILHHCQPQPRGAKAAALDNNARYGGLTMCSINLTLTDLHEITGMLNKVKYLIEIDAYASRCFTPFSMTMAYVTSSFVVRRSSYWKPPLAVAVPR